MSWFGLMLYMGSMWIWVFTLSRRISRLERKQNNASR